MTDLFPGHIILNGQLREIRELLNLQTDNLPEWEQEWTGFLKEWYSPKKWIEVLTSGSTGVPKKIRLTKEFVAASAQRTLRFFQLKEGHKVLHCLPSRYIAGKLMIVRSLLGRLDMRITSPSSGLGFLGKEQFEFAAMVPNQVIKILDSSSGENKLQNIRQLLIGGSAIPLTLEKRLSALSTRSCSSYAMTETATHIAIRELSKEGADGYYHCMDDIRVELSEKGCLKIFVPGLSHGYLETTDIAELKDPKTFRILGRADHIIISGGIKYSPETIEKKLETDITAPFMISSLPHEKLGRQIVLVVEGNGSAETLDRIKTICKKKLDKYEIPRQFIFSSKLPRTNTDKPDRNSLQRWLNEF